MIAFRDPPTRRGEPLRPASMETNMTSPYSEMDLKTITTENRFAVVSPTLINTRNGERHVLKRREKGQEPSRLGR